MDAHSPLMSHTRRRRPTCAPADYDDSDSRGSLLPVVVLIGGLIFAAGVWRDRKRVREAGQPGTGHPEQSSEEDNWFKSVWKKAKDFVWRPSPSLSYKGRACGQLTPPNEGEEAQVDSAPIVDADSNEEVTVGSCSLSKFEERWTVVSRSATCSFVPTSGPSGAAGSTQPAGPAPPDGTNHFGWQLRIGPARKPYVAADVSGELQLHEVEGEAVVKFKWDGGFWSLGFSSRSTVATFMAVFKAKQAAARKLLAKQSSGTSGNGGKEKRPGGDVRIEDILS